MNCRVETISSPSKQAPRIFQTSPEHPNARIIITPPYAAKSQSPTVSGSRGGGGGDIFDPQLPSKPPRSRPTAVTTVSDDNVRRTSGRKRTVTGKYDDGASISDSDSLDEGYSRKQKKQRFSESSKEFTTTASGETSSRRRKSTTRLLESTEVTTPTRRKEEKSSRPPSSSKSNREKEARLDRRENEELYETLQKQVTIDLLKRRYPSFLPRMLMTGEFLLRNKRRWCGIFVENWDLKVIPIWLRGELPVFVTG